METITIFVNQNGTKDASTLAEAFTLSMNAPANSAV